jgi:UDP-N-acetylglucosamine 2-epimerase
VKAAPVSRALAGRHEERLVHSGQHWDPALSQVFFDELGLPEPAAHLGAEGLPTAVRLARMIAGVREELRTWTPDVVLVYGDTDTTLAGALAGRREGVSVAHVEAGMRSGEPRMPEEINRIAVDHVASLLLAPTDAAAARLRDEHAAGRVEVVGDVMLDALLARDGTPGGAVAERVGVQAGEYVVATLHRAATVDDAEALLRVVRALESLDVPVLFPLHPRTENALQAAGAGLGATHVHRLPPCARGDMLDLLQGARGVVTDSGGLQREAWFLGVPCATLRDRTEWTETLCDGWNRLVGTDPEPIRAAVDAFGDERPARDLARFGGGVAAERVVAALETVA